MIQNKNFEFILEDGKLIPRNNFVDPETFNKYFDQVFIWKEYNSSNEEEESENFEDNNDKAKKIIDKSITQGIKPTADTSKQNKQDGTSKISFAVKASQKEIEYLLKSYKTKFSQFLTKYGNKIISNSKLPNYLRSLKLHLPNSISFTSNVTEKENNMFLEDFSVKDIFSYYKNDKGTNSRQIDNIKIIEKIQTFLDRNTENEALYQDIKSFFDMGLEKAYELFEKSNYFIEFSQEEKNVHRDKEFKRVRGYSLLEKNAFVKTMKMYNKNEITM